MWKALILKLEFDKTMFMYVEKPFGDKDPQTSIFFSYLSHLSQLCTFFLKELPKCRRNECEYINHGIVWYT